MGLTHYFTKCILKLYKFIDLQEKNLLDKLYVFFLKHYFIKDVNQSLVEH